MDIPCKKLVESYLEWLRATISTTDINGVCEITTPFLDRHNDHLQIYVQKQNGHLRLTDDGYIIGDLETGGCQLDTQHRKKMLETILGGFGVRQEGCELFVESSVEDFGKKKHALLQAMMTVNDMFMTSKQRVRSLFVEDVEQFLEASGARFAPSVEFTGKSGYTHRFDFLIPKSSTVPERVIRAINNPTRENATNLLFAWTDTKEVRPQNAQAYAILNDGEKPLNADVLSAFQHYEVKPVLWTQRDAYARTGCLSIRSREIGERYLCPPPTSECQPGNGDMRVKVAG